MADSSLRSMADRMGSMKAELALYSDHVGVTLTNNSDNDLRLWEVDCFEGWFTVSFQVRGVDDAAVSDLIHWWAMSGSNMARTFGLSPRESRELSMNLNHWMWMRDHKVSRL